jgi:hypothetical protein
MNMQTPAIRTDVSASTPVRRALPDVDVAKLFDADARGGLSITSGNLGIVK